MTIDTIKAAIIELVPKYGIKKVMLFGSRAMETHREDSDIDLIIEFRTPVSLLIVFLDKVCIFICKKIHALFRIPVKESEVCVVANGAMCFSGAIGINRLPLLFARHGCALTQCH